MQHRSEVGVSLGTQIVLLIAPGARESGYIRRPVADIRAKLSLNRLGMFVKARISQQPSQGLSLRLRPGSKVQRGGGPVNAIGIAGNRLPVDVGVFRSVNPEHLVQTS